MENRIQPVHMRVGRYYLAIKCPSCSQYIGCFDVAPRSTDRSLLPNPVVVSCAVCRTDIVAHTQSMTLLEAR